MNRTEKTMKGSGKHIPTVRLTTNATTEVGRQTQQRRSMSTPRVVELRQLHREIRTLAAEMELEPIRRKRALKSAQQRNARTQARSRGCGTLSPGLERFAAGIKLKV